MTENTETTEKTRKPRSKGPSSKDLEIEFFCNGIEGIRALIVANDTPRSLVERAEKALREGKGKDTAAFQALIVEVYGEKASGGGGGPGRAAPKTGDTLSYKAQQPKNGGVGLRVPLNTLGSEKGDLCRVSFMEDEQGPYLVVRRAWKASEGAPEYIDLDPID